jgi:hypothetical protein
MSSTSTSRADRGGLSRTGHRAVKQARRATNDELLADLFGKQADHFRETPLDGPDILGAVPKPKPLAPTGGTALPAVSAEDQAPGKQPDWFKDQSREGQQQPQVKPKAKKTQSFTAAVAEMARSLEVSTVVNAPKMNLGLAGEPGPMDDGGYDSLLDEIARPPDSLY